MLSTQNCEVLKLSEKKVIGFIGTGVMGASMAGHLLKSGCELHVYNRTKAKADKLIEGGAIWEENPAEVAKACDVVFTIIGYPADVEKVFLGKEGLIENAKAGALLVDMTTSSPKLARELYEAGKKRGVKVMDAPVTGGDKGARDAKLTIFAGGDKADFEEVLPLLKVMGENIEHMGEAGAGQVAKLVNQTVIAGTLTGMAEGLALAKAAGLDRAKIVDLVGSGSGGTWSISNYGPRILKGDFNPGFFIKHFIKDMRLAEETADELGMEIPALSLTRELFCELEDAGMDDLGVQALYCLYDPEEE
jgi:3-hydroxyisobutyrate dehydrogenase